MQRLASFISDAIGCCGNQLTLLTGYLPDFLFQKEIHQHTETNLDSQTMDTLKTAKANMLKTYLRISFCNYK